MLDVSSTPAAASTMQFALLQKHDINFVALLHAMPIRDYHYLMSTPSVHNRMQV
jgi:hypothetical protein